VSSAGQCSAVMSAPYVDKEFPPDARSLGPALPRNLQWRRAHEAVAVPGELADVFTGCIEPSDIRQVRGACFPAPRLPAKGCVRGRCREHV
jgi:hypothetical protein